MNSEWVYDHAHRNYFHPQSQTFAIANGSQWKYVPLSEFKAGESSRSVIQDPKEEGELEDDVGWGGLMEAEEVKKVQKSQLEDSRKYAYRITPPPETPKHILRLVVSKSSTLPLGGMAVVDAREGGTHLGRDRVKGQARIRVKQMEVSKTHAVVYWDEGWWIVDLGSTHGTFVDEHRLSDPKMSSLPYKLDHLATITLGLTTFIAHIHPSWPCDICQLKGDLEIRLDDAPESPAPITTAYQGKELREVKRKREMASLKETLLSTSEPSREYQDRAAMRRRLHPPSPPKYPEEETPALSVAASILAKQGWVHGQGLGKTGSGRAEPVQVEMRTKNGGLGAAGSKVVEGDWRTRGKERRYDELRK